MATCICDGLAILIIVLVVVVCIIICLLVILLVRCPNSLLILLILKWFICRVGTFAVGELCIGVALDMFDPTSHFRD